MIPNNDRTNNDIFITTSEEWKKVGKCQTFSVSSHLAACDKDGNVAAWGSMYAFEDDACLEEEEADENDYYYGNPKMVGKVIEKPCLILESELIRKVSCGDGIF